MPHTVFVVGAGASKEVGLPLGVELKARIGSALDIRYDDGYSRSSGDAAIDDAYRQLAQSAGDRAGHGLYQKAGWLVRDAMPQARSIDHFLYIHGGDERVEKCGKLGIARVILSAEESSSLMIPSQRFPPNLDFKSIEDTWYTRLGQSVTDLCRLDDLPARLESVAFVIFNYDRCVEHYLYWAIQNYYNLNQQDTTALLSRCRFYHPYGSLGPLPWAAPGRGIAFGQRVGGSGLAQIADGLKTFTEGTDATQSEIIEIRKVMMSARRVVFLGFAFQEMNMELLYPSGTPVVAHDAWMYGTALGLSDSDLGIIKADLAIRSGIHAPNVHLDQKMKCSTLWDAYSRSLSLVRLP